MSKHKKQILTFCGSLRKQSVNRALLRAIGSMIPGAFEVEAALSLDQLPMFNPDLDQEGEEPPETIVQLRAQFQAADGIILSTPEYVHGIPGPLKNAIDWLVSSGSFVKKPVLLLTVAAGDGQQVQDSLSHTLEVLEAVVVSPLSFKQANLRKGFNFEGELSEIQTLKEVQVALYALMKQMSAARASEAVS